MRPEPALPAVVGPTPVVGVHDAVEATSSQLVAAEAPVPQDKPRPAERVAVVTDPPSPTVASGSEAQTFPAPSKGPTPPEFSVPDAPRKVDVPQPAPTLPEPMPLPHAPGKEIAGPSSDPAVRIAEAPPPSGGPGRGDSVVWPRTRRIAITSPANGLRLAPDDPPIVVVEGEVEDASVSRVWLVANDRRIAVPVQSGRFRQALVIAGSTLHIHAEVDADGATAHRTSTVAVHSTSSSEFGIVMIDWPRGHAGVQVDLTARWRSNPDRLDAPVRTFPLRAVTWLNEGSTQAFYFRRPKPGVYSFILRHRGSGPAGEIIATLYLPRAGQLAPLVSRPIVTESAGPLLLGRVLLPWGVIWEQDDWFTGRVESVDTVTKFRMPEGVIWTEGRHGLRR